MTLYRWILIWFYEIRKINKSSRTKHTDNPYDLNNLYLKLKADGHLKKWWESPQGSRNEGPGAHHLVKVMWYMALIYWGERLNTITDVRKR